jgi:hypothetical protein
VKTECPHLRDVHAFLAGEMAPREHAEFSAHLEGCAHCSAAVDTTQSVLSRLTAVPDVECQRDLGAVVLGQIHAQAASRYSASQKRLVGIAAVIFLSAAGLVVREAWRGKSSLATRASLHAEAESHKRALDWLVRAQEPDGSWSAERWGGQRNYGPALTALPLLALATTEDRTPARDSAVARAAASLLGQQNSDGTFGTVFQGAPYNHCIATLALLQVWQRDREAVPKGALDRAVASLVARQTTAGAWGYRHSPLGDRSITQWHVQALETAAQLGWDTANSPAQRGVRWLAQRSLSLPESEEPTDSTSAILARSSARTLRGNGSVDFYHAYFTAAALKHDASSEAGERLASLKREILSQQVGEGADTGSWPPDDQWGRAGGRLYSTALASLSLSRSQLLRGSSF